MTSARLYFLLKHFRKHRIDWRKSKAPLAKELADYMDSTHVINPNDLKDSAPCPLNQFNQERLAENLADEQKANELYGEYGEKIK